MMPRRNPEPNTPELKRRIQDIGATADWRVKRSERETRMERELVKNARNERQDEHD
jgi:hypothetical protein